MAHINHGPSTNPKTTTPPIAANMTNLCKTCILVVVDRDDNTQGGK